MEVAVLASGSSGNATLVTAGGVSVLVDVGVSALQIRTRMACFGRQEEALAAVLLTHEHSDHVRGLEVLSKRRPVPVWTTAGTWSQLRFRAAVGGELVSGTPVCFGALKVVPVATSHDAAEPVAYVFDDGSHRIALCTDTGIMTALLSERLAGVELLLLEANHDPDMLRHGPYPWHLKQRIASRLGHLGNHQTEEAMDALGTAELKAVVGMHLSAENNSPELVRECLARSVDGGRVAVEAVTRSEMLRVTLDGRGAVVEKRGVPSSRR